MAQISTSLDATSLKQLLAGPRPPVLVDVRLDDDFKKSRLPHALSNCVYGADSGSISHTLEFQASASVTADDKLAAQAMLALDRTP